VAQRRDEMLLAIDIGNTNIVLGVFQEKKLIHHWKIQTEKEKTSDEYGVTLLNLFSLSGPEKTAIESVIISSVVPPLTPIFEDLSKSLFQVKPVVVGPGLKTGMSILYENPLEVGADRVVAAVAAYEKHGGPCLVVDFGTATTFDAVSSAGEYLGGAVSRLKNPKKRSVAPLSPVCSQGCILVMSVLFQKSSKSSRANWEKKQPSFPLGGLLPRSATRSPRSTLMSPTSSWKDCASFMRESGHEWFSQKGDSEKKEQG
jgi:hypothetical protein